MNPQMLDLIKMIADIAVIPAFGMLWSIQGRMSRIEGELKSLYSIIAIVLEKK